MAEFSLKASTRKSSGKSYASKIRREGRVPGVVYGPTIKAQAIELDAHEVELLHRDSFGKNALIKMDLDGKEQTVMFKDILREPVKSKLLHIDFYYVDASHPLKLDIPVVLDGVAAGVKEGGVLSHGVRAIHVRCLPDKIPSEIHVDISSLKVEENILVQSLTAPEGVTFLTDPHAVLAQISEVKEEEAPVAATEEAAAEGDAKPEEAKEGDAKAEDKDKKEEKK